MATKFTASTALLATMTLLLLVSVRGSSIAPLPPSATTCRYNNIQLSACLLNLALITPTSQCCTLLHDVSILEASLCACLCVGGITIDANLLLGKCGMSCPDGFACPN
ncbi:hypothetical protein QOZ80_2AG0124370 [Eleusine coracana subsp. coracana]|nr:hypothetical protein QOZ80_2AG0124370 [Eleusine coracana subsp. coracana]